jgi:hypothetical protein
MSHFTVLVRIPAAELENLDSESIQNVLADKLQPYHEFECTGVKDQYVIETDETDDHIVSYEKEAFYAVFNNYNEFVASQYSDKLSKYKDRDDELHLPDGWEIRNTLIKDVMNFEEYLTDWCGYSMDGEYSDFRDGRFYRYTNPNRQWDWWTVGGRWSNHFLDKEGNRHDIITKGDWDIEREATDAVLKYMKYHDLYTSHQFSNTYHTWEDCRNLYPSDTGAARQFYWNQPFRGEFYDVMSQIEDEETSWIATEIDNFWNVSREQFIVDRVFGSIGTYAVLDDAWYEKGEMGWFGISNNEKSNWNELFIEKVKSFDDNDLLILVDCHI